MAVFPPTEESTAASKVVDSPHVGRRRKTGQIAHHAATQRDDAVASGEGHRRQIFQNPKIIRSVFGGFSRRKNVFPHTIAGLFQALSADIHVQRRHVAVGNDAYFSPSLNLRESSPYLS